MIKKLDFIQDYKNFKYKTVKLGEVIKQARISNVYYLASKPSSKKEFNKTNFVKIDNESKEEEYLEILCDFFKKLREK